MADLTLEILNNREKFPDDMEITLVGGDKVTVKQFRDALQPRAEFTRASEAWAKEKRDLQVVVDTHQQQIGKLQSDLAEAVKVREGAGGPPAGKAGEYSEADLLADPVLGPMVKQLKEATETVRAHEVRLKNHEDTYLRERYTNQLEGLATRFNTRFNADGKGTEFDRKAFLDFAVQKGATDLGLAYDAWTKDKEIALAIKEAEERGVERGKAAAKVPYVPSGGRRRPPVKDKSLPDDLQSLKMDDVLNDPEMQEALHSDGLTG